MDSRLYRLFVACSLLAASVFGLCLYQFAHYQMTHFGYVPSSADSARFLASLDKPFLFDAAPQLSTDRKDTVLLYRSLNEAYQYRYGREWRVGSQGIGDCVSWGWAHAASIHTAVLWEKGEILEWQEVATEPIYGGSRVEAAGRSFGGWGDGSNGASAATWCRDYGLLFRQDYPTADLKTYSAQRAKQWGAYGCGGKDDNGQLDGEAKRFPVKHIALVRSFDEAAAAIANGYPVAVCSGQGFTSQRDKAGFARAYGKWSHCMVFIGVRHDRAGLLCLNSWGPDWISGPKYPDDQPDGSFWVDADTCTRMLRGGDSYAFAGPQGFKRRDHHWWAQRAEKDGPARNVIELAAPPTNSRGSHHHEQQHPTRRDSALQHRHHCDHRRSALASRADNAASFASAA